MTNQSILESYPKEIQQEVKSMLGAYKEINVITSNGEYQVSTGSGLMNEYPSDYNIETFNATEILTEEERMLGYIESFHEYPSNYNGNRNRNWLKNLDWDTKLKLDELGNVVVA